MASLPQSTSPQFRQLLRSIGQAQQESADGGDDQQSMSAGTPSMSDRWNSIVAALAPNALQEGLSLHPDVSNSDKVGPTNLADLGTRGAPLLAQMLLAATHTNVPLDTYLDGPLPFRGYNPGTADSGGVSPADSTVPPSSTPKAPPMSPGDWVLPPVPKAVNDVPRLNFGPTVNGFESDVDPFPPKPIPDSMYDQIFAPKPLPNWNVEPTSMPTMSQALARVLLMGSGG